MIRNININGIITGWSNWALDQVGLLDKETKKLAETRLKICETCEFRKVNNCGVCGCALTAKTKDPKSTCPETKW